MFRYQEDVNYDTAVSDGDNEVYGYIDIVLNIVNVVYMYTYFTVPVVC